MKEYDIFRSGDLPVIRGFGKTKEELLESCLLGLAAFLRPDVAPKSKTAKARVCVRGDNLHHLLRNFLNAALFESEMRDAVFSAVDIIHFSDDELECELVGKHVDHFEESVSEIVLPRRIEPGAYPFEVEILPLVL